MTRATKDSGVEWIGQIPERWHLTRIAGLYNLRNTKVSDKDFPALSVTNKGILPQLETAAKTNAGDNRKLVCIGDFAINSRSDRRGSCGISPYNGSVSLINLVLTPRSKTIPKYFDWLFHTVQFADEFYRWGHGIVDDLWSTGWEEMKKILVPLPPLPEQQAIADYLDDKCAQIDNITATINEQIEVLKQYKKSVITEAVTKGLDPNAPMKDSGVEWIGQIPEKWEIEKIKYISKLKGRIGWQGLTSSEYMEEGPYLITGTDFIDGKINWKTCTHISNERWEQAAEIKIKNGDLLITKDGSVGKVAIVDNLTEKASLNSGVLKIILNEKIIQTKYLFWVLLSDVFWHWFALKNAGNSTIIHLYQSDFSEFKFICPTLPEQQAIADYLDDKCAQIDAVVADKQAQLETLAAYKKSLIYEYVTGKKSVPGFEEA